MTERPNVGDPAAIVAGLSETQRKLLRAGSAFRFKMPLTIMRHAKVGRWANRPNYRGFSFCWEYEREPSGFLVRRRLSPLGEQVRRLLQEQL